MKKKFLFCAFIFVSVIFISCSKKNEKIQFDSLEPMAIEPGIEWLLVTSGFQKTAQEFFQISYVRKLLKANCARVCVQALCRSAHKIINKTKI